MRLGILGAGMIVTSPLGFLPGLSRMRDRCTVTAITSRTLGTAEAVAEEFGIPDVHDDLGAMLASGTVDAVVNCTPIGAHAETSLEIVRAGVHLVSEKPFAATRTGAEAILAAAARNAVEVVVAPARMLEPSRRRALRIVRDGEVGQVLSARFRTSHAGPAGQTWPTDPRGAYRADSGPLMDLAPYAVEQVVGLIGPVRRVAAMSTRSRASFPAIGDGPHAGVTVDVEADDTVSLLLEAGDGVVVVVDCSYGPVASRAPAAEIFGTDGTIALHARTAAEDGPLVETWTRQEPRWRDRSTAEDARETARQQGLGRAVLVEDLMNALEAGRRPICDGTVATQITAVLEAARESARTGGVGVLV